MSGESEQERDFVDDIIDRMNAGQQTTVSSEQTTVSTDQTTVETEQTTVETEQTTVETGQTTVSSEQTTVSTDQTTVEPKPVDLSTLTSEQQLEIFNRVTGLKLDSLENINEFSETFSKLPEFKKQIDLFPDLVEKIKNSNNVLSYFPDEVAYKAAQVVKSNPDYKGKEGIVSQILRSDLNNLNDLEILKLAASLEAPPNVKNPLRAKLSGMGLNPDDVIDNYSELSDDDADKIAMATGAIKRNLANLGSDIQVPESPTDILEQLENEKKAKNDELIANREKLVPVANSIVNAFTELKVDDQFSFKLEMPDDLKANYSQFIIDAVTSGEFDLSTEQGKKELVAAVSDEMFLDNRKEIIKSLRSSIRDEVEAEFREKYGNHKDLDREEPMKQEEEKISETGKVIKDMIQEMQ